MVKVFITSRTRAGTFLDGIIIDITRRKEAEFAAAESERNFKEMMDLSTAASF
jgi:hypothetical protein